MAMKNVSTATSAASRNAEQCLRSTQRLFSASVASRNAEQCLRRAIAPRETKDRETLQDNTERSAHYGLRIAG